MAKKAYISVDGKARKIKKGYVSIAEFNQPVLTTDGTLGGSSFAVYASNYYSADYAAYKAFNGNISDGYSSSVNPSNQTIYLTFYNPIAIKVSELKFTNVPSGLTSSSPKAFSVEGSDDNSSWSSLGSFTNTNNTNGATWSVNLSGGYYKYHRIVITSANTTQAYVNIGEINIVATSSKSVARKIKKAYISIGGGVRHKEVEYIQSSGTQYIDTKFVPDNNTRVVIDAEIITPGTASLFGARVSATNSNYALMQLSTYIRSDYNTEYSQQWSTSVTNRRVYDKNKETTTIDGSSQSYTNATFKCPSNMYLFATNENGTVKFQISAKVYSCKIYDNDKLVRDYVPVIDNSGNAGLFDKVSCRFYINAGTGNFTYGAETGNTYISNGIARPCWSGGELSYYGTITALSTGVRFLTATTVGDYALFGGGTNDQTYGVGTVNAYNSSLVKSNPSSLNPIRYNLCATTVGDYAIFGGGRYDSSRLRAELNYFNKSLTYGNVGTSMSKARENYEATTVGNYALFAGGYASAAQRNVDAYDSSLTYKSATALGSARYHFAATTLGNRAIFGGGYNGTNQLTSVESYNESLTRATLTDFSSKRYYHSATTVGDYALFSGSNDGNVTAVEVYDKSMTKVSAAELSVGRGWMAATTINGFAIFAGGYNINRDEFFSTVDIYDASLTRTTGQSLSVAIGSFATTTVGNYALFGGGYNYNSPWVQTAVDAYTVA